MRHRYLKLLVVALVVAAGLTVASASSNASTGSVHVSRIVNPANDSKRVIKFWTNARIKRAKSRDFVFNPASRKFRPAPSRRFPVDMFTDLGSSWTLGGAVQKTTGKVFFALGTQYYVCSGSVINDGSTIDRSIVVTAAHCAYDERNNVWATNWMFVPDYDSAPVTLTTSGSFCESTTHGCWSARSLVVPRLFASQPSFNSTAVKHDYAFAILGTGGKKSTHLDSEVGGQSIDFTKRDFESNTWLFGYPSQGKYKGQDLMFCKGLLGYDRAVDYETYRLGCRLTGGSSGGPWMSPFADSGTTLGSGTIFSVTSYGYTGIKALYGSIFGTETEQMFGLSKTLGSGNVLYPET